jgi:hypothetical protein
MIDILLVEPYSASLTFGPLKEKKWESESFYVTIRIRA